jgi:alpha-tubulin suppressor-like RCC1 family protein
VQSVPRVVTTKVGGVSVSIGGISAGNGFTGLVSNSGVPYTFGSNSAQALGQTPCCYSTSKATAINSYSPPAAPIVAQISIGNGFGLILSTGGFVYSAGSNNQNGQLGQGDFSGRGQYTKITTLSSIAAISAGKGTGFSIASLVITKTGTVYTFGGNTAGLLGIANTTIVNSNVPILNPFLTGITGNISASSHMLVINNVSQVLCWGDNSVGQCVWKVN